MLINCLSRIYRRMSAHYAVIVAPLFACVVFSAARASAQPAKTDQANAEARERRTHAADIMGVFGEALDATRRCFQGMRGPDGISRLVEDSDIESLLGPVEMQGWYIAAAALRRTHPAADLAGEHFAHSRFGPAIDAARRAIRDDRDDTYARLIAALAQLELRQPENARVHLAEILRVVPDAPRVAMLDELCERLIRAGPRCDDAAIVFAADELFRERELRREAACAAARAAEGENDAPKIDAQWMSRTLIASMAEVTVPPPDPVFAKFEAEAALDRGPWGLNAARVIAELRRIESPGLRYARGRKLFGTAAEARVSLEIPARCADCDTVDFLLQWSAAHDLEALIEHRVPEFVAEVRRRCELDPDEALWRLLQIPACDGVLNADKTEVTYPPLSAGEVALLRTAADAPRVYSLDIQVSATESQFAVSLAYPCRELLDGLLEQRAISMWKFRREILVKRAGATIDAALAANDTARAAQVFRAGRRLFRRTFERNLRSRERFVLALHEAYARAELEQSARIPTLDDDEYRESLENWLCSICTRVRTATLLPAWLWRWSPIVARADDAAASWREIELGVERHRRHSFLTDADEALFGRLESVPPYRPEPGYIASVACVRRDDLLPCLRVLRDENLQPTAHAALVWALRSLRDRESAEWIERQRSHARGLVRAACEVDVP